MAERLERLTADAGMSMNALTVRERYEASRRADAVTLLEVLPGLSMATDAIVVAVGQRTGGPIAH